jgi:C_GCAxxG_C_C family probable redox protein
MSTPVDRAVANYSQGFNCSQSVFSAFAEQFGLGKKTALKLASPFGGGMGRHGEVCGAVSGALLALGLARGADQPSGKEGVYQLTQEFMRRFEQKHGSLLCRTLLGSDISTPEGLQRAREAGKFSTICPMLVQDAAEIIGPFLETAD